MPGHDEDLLHRFTAAYRGPHRPEDALWWLDHPDSAGPSGAPSPGAEAARLRRDLYLPQPPVGARERYREVERRVAADAALAAEARHVAERPRAEPAPGPEPPPPAAAPQPRRRSRLWAALGALAVLAGAVVAGLALAPRPPQPDPPIRLSAALWSGHGTAAATTPVLQARGSALWVRLTCHGSGRILLAVAGNIRSVGCRAGGTVRDDQYFQGPHDDFQLSLSIVDAPRWTVSVHRVLSPAAG